MCLFSIMAQGKKMLKPEKWQAIFDSEGRVSCFTKAQKLIVLGVSFCITNIFFPYDGSL